MSSRSDMGLVRSDMNGLVRLAALAAGAVAHGDPDKLIVLPNDAPTLPGTQDDDGVRAIAAIDVLRYLVEHYEEEST